MSRNKGRDPLGEDEEDDMFVIKRSGYTPKSFVDLVDDDEEEDNIARKQESAANTSKAAAGTGRNPFERILASTKENQHVSKKLKLSPTSTAMTTTTTTTGATTTAVTADSDLPMVEQRFTVDLVRYLLSLKTVSGSSEAQQPKFSTDSLKAIGELMHIFVTGELRRFCFGRVTNDGHRGDKASERRCGKGRRRVGKEINT